MSRDLLRRLVNNRWLASLAVLSLVFSYFTFIDSPEPTQAGVSTSNLVLSYDFSNSSTYSGSGSTFNDLSSGGHTGTISGNANISSGTYNSVSGSNGTAYSTIGGSFTGFNNGITVTFEGNLGSFDNWERIISLGDTAANSNGLWNNGGDGFWVGRIGTTNELAIESFTNGATSGQCRTSGAATDSSYGRWTFTISSTGLCRIYKNGSELATNNTGGPNNLSGTQLNIAPSSATLNANYLGRSQWTADSDLGGGIKWLKVYNTALTFSEVTDETSGSVTFNANGGTGSMATQSYAYANTLTNNTFTRAGYTFAGWNTVAVGGGYSWSNGATYSFSDDITLYAQWTMNAPTVTISGTAKSGQTLTASPSAPATGITSSLSWERSSNGSTWTTISGATATTYTLTDADITNYVRVRQSLTDGTLSNSSVSNSSALVQSVNSVTGPSGTANEIGSMFSVPAGSTVYNVTLTSSNLSGLFSLATTTGLTWVEGYSSTASYMPTSISGTGSIFSFRGTGDAINSALATLKYNSSTVQTDTLKIYYAVGSTTATDITNYIPIYDASASPALSFHYYTKQNSSQSSTYTNIGSGTNTYTLGSITSANPWYLATPRTLVEHTRLKAIIGASYATSSLIAGRANSGSSTWYWPANTDGFSSSTNIGTTYWATSQPSSANTSVRVMTYWCSSTCTQANLGWDDTNEGSFSQYLAETYSSTPLGATTSSQTFRTITGSTAPTALTATAATATSTTLSWTAPSSSGTDSITDYKIQYSTDNTTWTTWSHTASTSTTATITGLTSGVEYWFRVAAVTTATGAYATSVSNVTGSTNLVARGVSTGMVALTWTRPMIPAASGITGYKIEYSTSATFATVTGSVTTTTTDTNYLYTGLPTAGATYYFRVSAVGSGGTSVASSISSAATTASATTINIVTSGGGTLNTDFTTTGGLIAAKGATTVSINSSDLQAVLATNPQTKILADTVNISGAVTWSANSVLTLGNSTNSTVAIAADLTASGNTAGLKMPAACTYGTNTGCYALAVRTGANIVLSGSSPSLVLGATTFTVINTVAGLSTVTASSNWALGNSLNLTSTYTGAVINVIFAGSLDGLGNTLNNMKLSPTVVADTRVGLFPTIEGATLRNIGFLNVSGTVVPTTSGNNLGISPLAALALGTNVVDKVWSTGSIVGNDSGTSIDVAAAGLISRVYAGSTTITRAWSSMNIDLSSITTNQQMIGGLVGGTPSAMGQGNTSPGGSLTIKESYTTGSLDYTDSGWRGVGGILGLHYDTGTVLLVDVFSWGRITNFVNAGGIIGGWAGSSISASSARVYTSDPNCIDTYTSLSWCTAGVIPGTNVTALNTDLWTGGSTLTYVTAPTIPLYVKPVAPTDGTAETVGYKVYDGVGNEVTASFMTTNNFSISGTPTWDTISAGAAVGTYNVSYVAGLTIGGTAAALYSLNPWPSSTSISITKLSQSVTWSPTTLLPYGTGSATPSSLATASTAITYSLVSAGTTGCSVNASTGVLTYTAGGTCQIKATAAATGNYLTATKTISFTISPPAAVPTPVTVTGTNASTLFVGWNTPTVTASTPITGYIVKYSTSSAMTSATTVTMDADFPTRTWIPITGLTANTTYYVTVQAKGANWTGDVSTAVSGATKTTGTTSTLNVVASGGGTSGTNFISNGGAIVPGGTAGLTTASINAAALEAMLVSGDVVLAADTVTISAPVSWTSNSILHLGVSTSSKVAINADLTSSGSTAGLRIAPAACAYGVSASCYSLDTKNGTNIVLSGSNASLKIGGSSYTLIDSVSDLSSVQAGWWYALAKPITFTSAVSSSPFNMNYTGTFDGLGNTVDSLTIQPTASGQYGFFAALSGATVRNLGVTNFRVSTSAAANMRIGAIAGNAGVANATATTIDNVWSTGFITSTATTGCNEVGGIAGGAATSNSSLTSRLNISRAWSNINISTATNCVGSGGIIGTNVFDYQQVNGYGNTLTVNEAYSTGNISRSMINPLWYGTAGIIGVSYGASQTIQNSFSWGTQSPGATHTASTAGISGVGIASLSNVYTTSTTLGATCVSTCATSVVAGTQTTGFTTGTWTTTNGSSLVSLAPPTKNLYVKLKAPTDGSYGTMSYEIVDPAGTVQNLSSLNLSVSGTPVYTITSATPVGTYSVGYLNGFTLGGTAALQYSLNRWQTDTSVTITKVAQTISWSPTTNLVRTDTGTTVIAAVPSGGTTMSYAVTSAGSTGCQINSSTRVLTFTAEGSCTVTASAANEGSYLAASTTATFVITTAAPLAPTSLTVTGGAADGALDVSWIAPSTTTTGGSIASYTLEYSSDGSTWTSVTGLTGMSYTITGLTNGTGYSVRVRAVNSASMQGSWAATANSKVPFWVASNTAVPVLSGTPVGGLDVTGTDGTWDYNGGQINTATYQWQYSVDGYNNWTDISSATTATYTVSSEYVDKYLRLAVSVANGSNSNQAITAYSDPSEAVQSGLAAEPTISTAVAGDQKITVTWAAPLTANGGTVSAYKVLYRSGTSGAWTTASSTVSASDTSYEITGLDNGTGYTVQVLAVTAAGDGAVSETTTTSIPAAEPINSALPEISGTPAVGRTLSASDGTWLDNGDAITGYTYQWQSAATSGGTFADISGATSSTYTLTSAESGKYVTVVVTATNNIGSTSATSAASSAVESGVTDAPSSVTATFHASPTMKVTVSWVAPTSLNGASGISGYTVAYSTSLNGTYSIASNSVPAGDTSLDVTGLSSGTTYYFKVYAQTAAGDSPAGTTGSVLFGGAPTNTTTPVLTGSTGVGETLSVTEGNWNDYGVTISGYTYTWQRSLTGISGWNDISGANSSSYELTSDDSGNYVRVIVTASNDVGSTSATVDAGLIANGVASAPQSVTVTEGDQQLVVNWSAPSTTNGGIVRNYAVAKKVGSGSWTTVTSSLAANATSYTITGLTNGESVDVKVWAITTLAGDATTVTGKIPYGAPIISTQPSLSGPLGVAETLALAPGSANSNGRSITQTTYQWQVSSNSGTSWSDVSGATSTSYTIPSGATGNLYRAKVSRTNLGGTTVATTTATTAILSGIADAPTGVTASRGNTQLTVSWTTPANTNNGTITGYTVKYRVGTTGAWTTASSSISASADSYVITGLTNGTGYTVQVNADTSAGAGVPEATSNVATPSTVATNSAVPVISGTVAVGRELSTTNGTWDNGGAALTYTYQWQSASTTGGTYTNISGATSSTYTPVTADSGMYIKVVVSATNVAGSVSATSAATTVVQTGLAAAPTFNTPTAGDGQIIVNWSAPSTLNGGVISNYNVYYQASGGSSWTQVSRSASTTTSQLITGLTNGTGYNLKVEAVTAAGAGAAVTYAATSSSTPFVAPVNTILPALNASAAVALQITTTDGTWTTYGHSATYSKQWQYSADGQNNWIDISGATASSFTITSTYIGKYLRSKVVANNGAANTTVAYSAASAVIESGLASAPQSLTVTRSNAALNVSWTAPVTLNGGWLNKYWVEYSTNGTNWTVITDQVITGTSFTIPRLTNGTGYYVRVAGSTAAGTGTYATTPTTTVPSTVPSNTSAPTVVGNSANIAVGVPLSSTTGTWNSNGATITGYTYQWQMSGNGTDWVAISGATQSTFTPTTAQIGYFIRVWVFAENIAGSGYAPSGYYGRVKTGLANAPTNVTGTFSDVSGLHTRVSWTGPSTLNGATEVSAYQVSYATSANGIYTVASDTISGSATSYDVTGLASGSTYFFKVAAITAAGTGELSSATSGVLYGAAPSNTAAPVISGSTGNGETLTVSDGTWNVFGIPLSSLTYQWQRSANGTSGWSDITGETYSSYTLTSADVGSYVRVSIDASNSVGTTTANTAAVLIGSAIASAPRNLSVTEGDHKLDLAWAAPSNLNGGILRNYRVEINSGSGWSTVTSSIADTATDYSITGLTNGTNYTVRVTALTTQVGTAAASASDLTPYGAPLNTALPSISGALAVGETLEAADGTWDSNGRFITGTTYQWQESTDSGQTFVDIPGATSDTYTLPAGTNGNYYQVVVTQTNPGGSTSAASAATTVIDTGIALAPTNLSLTRGDHTISATWNAPADLHGGILRDYAVEYRVTGSNASWTRVSRLASTVTSQEITGLVNGTSYDVRVLAITTSEGATSTESSAIPAALPLVVSSPLISGELAEGYTLSASGGVLDVNSSGTLSYSVRWEVSADGLSGWTAISGATSSTFTLTSAEVGQFVRFVKTGTNNLGSTDAPSAATLDAIGTGIPAAPASISVSAGNDQQLDVTWNSVAGSDLSGAARDGYLIEYSVDGVSWTALSLTGATSTSETITGLTNGTAYFVRVAAVSTLGVVGAYVTTSTATVPYYLPINTSLPAVSGQLANGYELSATSGLWNDNGNSITSTTYQWQTSTDQGQSWTDISSATGTTFLLTSNEVGSQIRIKVTTENAAGETDAYSTPTAIIDSAIAAAPTNIQVTPEDGQLAVSWDAPTVLNGGTIVDYKIRISTDNNSWTTVSHPVSTSTNITIASLTNGTTYWVSVAAITTVTGTSASTFTAFIPYGVPLNTALPAVSGTTQIGETLSATAGTWDGNGRSLTSSSYQWQVSDDGLTNWSDISGATSATYTPMTELGKYLRVNVTATNAPGSFTTVSSVATAQIDIGTPDAPTWLSLIAVDQGISISWTAPTWLAGGSITDYTVEYKDSGSWLPISRAASTTTSYTLTGLTIGSVYQVRLRTETGMSSSWVTSGNFTVVGQPTITTAPSVTGTALVGSQLSVSDGTWDTHGSSLTSVTYQWQQSTNSGQSWSDVSGATNSTLTAVAGRIYRAVVTATNAAGSTTSISNETLYVVSSRPGVPTAVTVTPDDQALDVNWVAPTNLGGGVITDYTIEYSVASAGTTTWVTVPRTASATTSQRITGLTNGVDYDVRVFAHTSVMGNSAGYSPTAVHPYGAPIWSGSASSVSGTVRFGSTLTSGSGTWDWNGTNSAGVTYQWQYSTNSGNTWNNIPSATGSSYAINGYVSGIIRVALTATNDAGQTATAYSNPTSVVDPANPSVPLNFTAVPHDGTVALSWNTPANLGGATLNAYEVQYSVDGTQWNSVSRSSSTTTSETITGLTNGVDYEVRVRAVTGSHITAYGGWTRLSAITPYGLPIATSAPSLTGTAKYDSTLFATAGVWDENGRSVSIAYQWQYFNGSTWTDISGATNPSYLIGEYVGSTIRVSVTATNAAGLTVSSSNVSTTVVAASPNEVTELTVQPADESVQVTWNAPSYIGGAPITDYSIEYAPENGSWLAVSRTPSATTSQTITGLVNGTSYQVRIRALNGATGAAATSLSVIPRGNPISTTAPVISFHPNSPTTPQINRAMSLNTGTWNANGNAITSYTYQWQFNNGSGWVDISGATNSSYTPQANVGSTLRVKVTATNVAGATDSYTLTTPAIIPAASTAPRNVSVAEFDQGFVLTWAEPSSTGGAPVLDYEVQTSVGQDVWISQPHAASPATTQTITGLTNAVEYSVRVRALNGVNGSWAYLSAPAVPRGLSINTAPPEIAGAPNFGAVLSASEGTWDGNGAEVERFSYQWQSSRDGQVWTDIPQATSANYTVGLYVGSQIRVVVSAINEAGSQSIASASTQTITAIPAATPVITSQSLGNAQITLGWTPPAHSGGVELVGYTLEYSIDKTFWTSQSFSATTTSATLTGLTNGAAYFARVRAETDRAGLWSPIAGPFTPVAPIVPVTFIAPSPTTSPIATAPESFTLLRTSVMPIAPTTTNITSLTGDPTVQITEDGRIELSPTQSVMLRNGEPVAADAVITNTGLTVTTDSVTVSVSFEAPTTSVGVATLAPGSAVALAGSGYAAGTPVVSWIQSDPIKLGESITSVAGQIDSNFAIPSSLSDGEHTIQINGLAQDGAVISIIYGVQITSAPVTVDSVVTWPWMLVAVAVVVAALVVWVILRRRKIVAS